MYYLHHLTTVKRDDGRPLCKHRPTTTTKKKSTESPDRKPIKEESERGNDALENHGTKRRRNWKRESTTKCKFQFPLTLMENWTKD